jgi:hypothetical protein
MVLSKSPKEGRVPWWHSLVKAMAVPFEDHTSPSASFTEHGQTPATDGSSATYLPPALPLPLDLHSHSLL